MESDHFFLFEIQGKFYKHDLYRVKTAGFEKKVSEIERSGGKILFTRSQRSSTIDAIKSFIKMAEVEARELGYKVPDR